MRRLIILLAGGAILAAPAFCDTSATGDTSVTLNVGPEASITITDSTSVLSKDASGIWGAYTGNTNFSYKLRTTESTGSGTLLMKFAGALTNSGSDTIALTNLKYTCTSMGSAATKCGGGGAVTTSSSASTGVATFGAGKHLDNENGEVNWTLSGNSPSWKTSDYSAITTFTIAAL